MFSDRLHSRKAIDRALTSTSELYILSLPAAQEDEEHQSKSLDYPELYRSYTYTVQSSRRP